VSRSALKSKDLFNGLLSKDGIAETVGNVGELLLLSPLNVKLCTLIVVVVMCMLTVL
jgi:hypothetical protein